MLGCICNMYPVFIHNKGDGVHICGDIFNNIAGYFLWATLHSRC